MVAVAAVVRGVKLTTGRSSGPPLIAASSHHAPSRMFVPSMLSRMLLVLGSCPSAVPRPLPGCTTTPFVFFVAFGAPICLYMGWWQPWQLWPSVSFTYTADDACVLGKSSAYTHFVLKLGAKSHGQGVVT